MPRKKSLSDVIGYRTRSVDLDRKAASESAYSGMRTIFRDGIKVYKIVDRVNTIKILPPTWENPEHWSYAVKMHFGIGQHYSQYLSLREYHKGRDPFLEIRAALKRHGRDEEAKQVGESKRYLAYVIDRDNPDDGPQIVNLPYTLRQAIITRSFDRKSGRYLTIDCPDSDPSDNEEGIVGYDVSFFKDKNGVGQGMYPGERVDVIEHTAPVEVEWLEYIIANPIPDVLVFSTYEDILTDYLGGLDGDDPLLAELGPLLGDNNPFTSQIIVPSSARKTHVLGVATEKKPRKVYTYEALVKMSMSELAEVAAFEKLDLMSDEFPDEFSFASAICDELGIVVEATKPVPPPFPKLKNKVGQPART